MKSSRHCPIVLTVIVVFGVLPPASGQIYPPGISGPPPIPSFDASLFGPSSATITNPYFPLAPGTIYTYEGQDDEETVVSRTYVTPDTREIAGVLSRVVQDSEYVDGVLMEDTFDWYAQDLAGNVWYMGEDTTAYEYDDEGNLIGTSQAGAWEAGQDVAGLGVNALPGYIMLADPDPLDHYYQEYYPGEAVDEAVVVSLDESISIDFDDFTDVLQIYETSALEPDAREYKYYAPGVGLVFIEEDLSEELADPEFTMELVDVQVIPEPMSLSLVAIGLGGVAWMRRRFR